MKVLNNIYNITKYCRNVIVATDTNVIVLI